MLSIIEAPTVKFNRARHRALWCFNRHAGHIEQLL
jgi:hypothetical protein